MPTGFRRAGRSAIQPPANFAKLERPSETPSMIPSAYAGAPRLARNAGKIAVAASWPQSEKRLASPMPRTPRVSQRLDSGGLDFFVGIFARARSAWEALDIIQRDAASWEAINAQR